MIAIVIAIAVGIPIALLLDRQARGTLLASNAMLLGLGFCAAVLFTLALVGIPWSRPMLFFIVVLSGGTAASAVWRRRRAGADLPERAHWLDLFTLAGLLGYALFSTIAPLWEFDYIGNWGLKARLFWEIGGFDWPFLENAWHRAIHPDYPLLLPLSFDFMTIVANEWNDRAFGLLNVLFAAALLLCVRRMAMEETRSAWMSAFIAAAMLPLAASPWIGLAEAPLVAYGTVGILVIRSAMAGEESRVATAAVLLGLAASSKNEGLTLIVAVVIALVLARQARMALRLWPAVVIPIPWLIARATHDLPTDHFSGSFLSRVMAHLAEPGPLLEALARYPVGKPFYWIGVLLAVILLLRHFTAGDRFALGVVALQFAFYIGAYLTSPHDLDWHIRWSWERVVSHVSPTLTAVLLLATARRLQTFATPAPAAT